MTTALYGHAEILKLLAEHNANLNEDSFGGTALHIAVQSKQEKIISLLVELGADINVRDNKG